MSTAAASQQKKENKKHKRTLRWQLLAFFFFKKRLLRCHSCSMENYTEKQNISLLAKVQRAKPDKIAISNFTLTVTSNLS